MVWKWFIIIALRFEKWRCTYQKLHSCQSFPRTKPSAGLKGDRHISSHTLCMWDCLWPDTAIAQRRPRLYFKPDTLVPHCVQCYYKKKGLVYGFLTLCSVFWTWNVRKYFVRASYSTLSLIFLPICFQMITSLQISSFLFQKQTESKFNHSHALDVILISRLLHICVGSSSSLQLYVFIAACHMHMEVQLHDLRCGSQLVSCELPFVLAVSLLSSFLPAEKVRIQTFPHLPHTSCFCSTHGAAASCIDFSRWLMAGFEGFLPKGFLFSPAH